MIHATNLAVIAVDGVERDTEDLAVKHPLCEKHVNAKIEDILLTKEDDAQMVLAFKALIMDMLVQYSPKAKKWHGYTEMLEEVSKMVPQDRQMPSHSVNEGSKKVL